MTNITKDWASIAVQGPKSKEMLTTWQAAKPPPNRSKTPSRPCPWKATKPASPRPATPVSPLGYEVYVRSEDAAWLWNRLIELGARPAGLGARDTLRMEAALPLYGHEMGIAPMAARSPSSPSPCPSSPSASPTRKAISSAALP